MVRFLSILTLLLLCSGCYMSHSNESLVTFRRGGSPILMRAPWDGEYSLYIRYDEESRATYTLKEGDLIGFKPMPIKSKDIIGVAGNEEFRLPEGDYVWKKR